MMRLRDFCGGERQGAIIDTPAQKLVLVVVKAYRRTFGYSAHGGQAGAWLAAVAHRDDRKVAHPEWFVNSLHPRNQSGVAGVSSYTNASGRQAFVAQWEEGGRMCRRSFSESRVRSADDAFLLAVMERASRVGASASILLREGGHVEMLPRLQLREQRVHELNALKADARTARAFG